MIKLKSCIHAYQHPFKHPFYLPYAFHSKSNPKTTLTQSSTLSPNGLRSEETP